MLKLKNYTNFYTHKYFMTLTVNRKTLLREQYKVMRQYLNILNCRLDILLTNEDKTELENGTK